MLYKKAVFENFSIFTGKHLYWSFFLIKLQAWRPATSLKRESQHKSFPIIIAKFLKTLFWRKSANDCFCFSVLLFIDNHCVKSVQMRSFFWSVFSSIRAEYGKMRCRNTDQKKLRIWTLFTQCNFTLDSLSLRVTLSILTHTATVIYTLDSNYSLSLGSFNCSCTFFDAKDSWRNFSWFIVPQFDQVF